MDRDERGVILLPALLMGVVLTGMVLRLVVLGDGLLFRTALQDAADGAAFESAVWHARGMNAVAVLNLLMTAVLAVFALVRLVELALLVAAASKAVTLPALALLQGMATHTEPVAAETVDAALRITRATRDAVVELVPQTAAAVAGDTGAGAVRVATRSLSLLPPALDAQLKVPSRMPTRAASALPVQDDDAGRLCAEAAALAEPEVPEVMSDIAGDLGKRVMAAGLANSTARGGQTSASELAKDLASARKRVVAGARRSFGARRGDMCRHHPVEPPLAELLALTAGTASARSACARVLENLKARPPSQMRPDQRVSLAYVREELGCAAVTDLAEAQRPPQASWANRRSRRRAGSRGSHGATPALMTSMAAKVWAPAANGSVFFDSWAQAVGSPPVPGAGNGAPFAHDLMGNFGGRMEARAAAEFYFPCRHRWSHPMCEPASLWTPQWTARMRRYHAPDERLRASVPNHASVLLAALRSRGAGSRARAGASEPAPSRSLPRATGTGPLARLLDTHLFQRFHQFHLGLADDVLGPSAPERVTQSANDTSGAAPTEPGQESRSNP